MLLCSALNQMQLRRSAHSSSSSFFVCHSIPFIITASSFIIRGAVRKEEEEEEERNDSEKDNSNFGCGSGLDGELKRCRTPLPLAADVM